MTQHTLSHCGEPPNSLRTCALYVYNEPECLPATQPARREALRVLADVYSDNQQMRTVFDATPWALAASDEALFKVVCEEGFGGGYASDEAAQHINELGLDAQVTAVFRYIELINESASSGATLGFEVRLAEAPLWRYLRAFRYALFVRCLLARAYGSLPEAEAFGYGVREDADQPGWYYFLNAGEGSMTSYDTEQQAWSALGQSLTGLACLDEVEVLDDAQRYPLYLEIRAAGGARPLRSECCLEDAADAAAPDESAPARVAGRRDAQTGQPLVLLDRLDAPSVSELYWRISDSGRYGLDFIVPVALGELIDGDIEWLNDTVSERICDNVGGLVDISYEVAQLPAALIGNTQVAIRVFANLEPGAFDDELFESGEFDEVEEPAEGDDASQQEQAPEGSQDGALAPVTLVPEFTLRDWPRLAPSDAERCARVAFALGYYEGRSSGTADSRPAPEDETVSAYDEGYALGVSHYCEMDATP